MYFYSGRLALSSTRAKKIEEGEYQDVVGIITFLTQKEKCQCLNFILLKVINQMHLQLEEIQRTAVAVTTGILKVLNREELEGVLAHELSHIKNRDILVSSIAAMLAAALSFMTRIALWGGGNRSRGTHPLVSIIAFIAAPIASIIIRMAISRTREFGADKTGAEISGNPLALASALEKIEQYSKLPMPVNPAVSQLFISDPMKAFSRAGVGKLFSTHPPTKERVRRLRQEASGIRYR